MMERMFNVLISQSGVFIVEMMHDTMHFIANDEDTRLGWSVVTFGRLCFLVTPKLKLARNDTLCLNAILFQRNIQNLSNGCLSIGCALGCREHFHLLFAGNA
jgi:hypothetical protein